MDETISKGCTVVSLRGRDHGKIFLVLDTGLSDYLLLVDGSMRKLESPKKKKKKHVAFYRSNDDIRLKEKLLAGEKITNAEIRRMILSQPAQDGSEDDARRD